MNCDQLRESLRQALAKYDYIEFALLFGSTAEGRALAMSDVDVGIYITGELSLLELGQLTADLERSVKRSVDVVILNEIPRKNPVLAFDVVSRGKRIFCHNEKLYTTFKTEAFLAFFDTAPLRAMFNQALRQRLAAGTFGKRDHARKS